VEKQRSGKISDKICLIQVYKHWALIFNLKGAKVQAKIASSYIEIADQAELTLQQRLGEISKKQETLKLYHADKIWNDLLGR